MSGNGQVQSAIFGKNVEKLGITPAIALINPKYEHNVANVIRAASCYNFKQVWFTGNRVSLDNEGKKENRTVGKGGKKRLPREERMKGYRKVELRQHDYFFEAFQRGVTPVAIELRPNSEPLHLFEHPEHALYVFGPEDGSIPGVVLQHCHRFVVIPTAHCLNLASAVYTVLYDRMLKRVMAGLEESPTLDEDRGIPDPNDLIYSL